MPEFSAKWLPIAEESGSGLDGYCLEKYFP